MKGSQESWRLGWVVSWVCEKFRHRDLGAQASRRDGFEVEVGSDVVLVAVERSIWEERAR